VLPSAVAHLGASTINRKVAVLAAFFAHHARDGVDLGELLATWRLPGRQGGWKPLLHHVTKGLPQPRRMVAERTAVAH
jgi:hypothetical protein